MNNVMIRHSNTQPHYVFWSFLVIPAHHISDFSKLRRYFVQKWVVIRCVNDSNRQLVLFNSAHASCCSVGAGLDSSCRWRINGMCSSREIIGVWLGVRGMLLCSTALFRSNWISRVLCGRSSRPVTWGQSTRGVHSLFMPQVFHAAGRGHV